jgi:hypothetical protein
MQDIPRFSGLPILMQRIFLDFVFHDFKEFDFKDICRWLTLVHDEHESSILACVSQPPVSYVGGFFAILI